MKVIRRRDWQPSERDIRAGYSKETNLDYVPLGVEFRVFGMSLVTTLKYLIGVGKPPYPHFLPATLFEVTNPTLDSEWVFRHSCTGRWDFDAAWGLREFTLNESRYVRLIECEPEEVELFESLTKRVEQHMQTPACPYCGGPPLGLDDLYLLDGTAEVVRCRDCWRSFEITPRIETSFDVKPIEQDGDAET